MNCEKAHMYLLNEENQALCPFCDEQLEETKSVEKKCRGRPNITVDGFKQVCTNCGSVNGYQTAIKFVDFYENIHRIRKKSVYHRKYDILKVIKDVAQKNSIQIGYYNREKILRIFELIDQVSPEVDTGQRRIISINFILKQLFDIFGIKYKFIPLTKSRKTLKCHNFWWKQVYGLIKDDIISK